jgi:hypothetical protein
VNIPFRAEFEICDEANTFSLFCGILLLICFNGYANVEKLVGKEF